MDRQERFRNLRRSGGFDLVVVGGGATGLGVAVEAAGRGLSVALMDRHDFCHGTSSRSTKLIHGGVRYLAQGNLGLVRDALRERGILARNVPHLVKPLPLVLPVYRRLDGPFYWTGLKAYDVLAGRLGLGHTRWLSSREVVSLLPGVSDRRLRGGVLFYDGQFDDSRLGISLLRTGERLGATLLNYVGVEGLLFRGAKVCGVAARDRETGAVVEVPAKVVVNACGTGADAIRRMADPGVRPRIALSRGSHVVLPRSCLGSDTALLVPKTDDGRVLFAIPWYGCLVAGTTDIPVETDDPEPAPAAEEIDFILAHLGRYLRETPTRDQMLSSFAGLRPLVGDGGVPGKTSALSRDHVLEVLGEGLLSIMGGKWTTYRKMAEDAVDRAVSLGGLQAGPSVSAASGVKGDGKGAGSLAVYGDDAAQVRELTQEHPEWEALIHPELPYLMVQVVWAARRESARTLGDVLSRRTRSLLLNARAAAEAAPAVAGLLAKELGRDKAWADDQVSRFRLLARVALGTR
jgi:glycerol-3-phosphate dehydrogenase